MRIALAFALLLAAFGSAHAAEERLGDRLFFVRDKPGSATKFQMIVNAGCLDEAGGQCRGLAHYLEHIVLVGRNPEHKDSAVRMFAGASANGWTNARATVYLHDIPATASAPVAELEKLFGFYAARLKDFAITEEDAARERNVVLQEHDSRIQSNPFSLIYRDLARRLLPDHPSGQWTIGTRDEIKAFTVEQARAFHQNW
jgi:zinc protease